MGKTTWRKAARSAPNRRTRAIAAAGVLGLLLAAATWWQSNAAEEVPLSKVSHIHGIAVDRDDPEALLLATHYGVYRAEDGSARRISETGDDFMGFTAHPTAPQTYYASGHPAGGGNLGVLVSRDGGRTWQQLSEGANGPVDFHAMDVSAADPDVMYGLYGQVQVSRDGGQTWRIAGAPPAETFALAASARKPEVVYAATRGGLMQSPDAGERWSIVHAAGQPVSMVEVAPDGTLFAFVVGEGLVKAAEPELEWDTLDAALAERVLLHLAIDPSDPQRLFAVDQQGAILTSEDGGQSWQEFAS